MKLPAHKQQALTLLRAALDSDQAAFGILPGEQYCLKELRRHFDRTVLPLLDLIERSSGPNTRERELLSSMERSLEVQRIVERAAADTKTQTIHRTFYPGPVTRPDAGGQLWAPVDQEGVESGDTPSYNYHAVARRCHDLNEAKQRQVTHAPTSC